jgi:hypothetical protein
MQAADIHAAKTFAIVDRNIEAWEADLVQRYGYFEGRETRRLQSTVNSECRTSTSSVSSDVDLDITKQFLQLFIERRCKGGPNSYARLSTLRACFYAFCEKECLPPTGIIEQNTKQFGDMIQKMIQAKELDIVKTQKSGDTVCKRVCSTKLSYELYGPAALQYIESVEHKQKFMQGK